MPNREIQRTMGVCHSIADHLGIQLQPRRLDVIRDDWSSGHEGHC
jgi:hypothetical protein